MQVLWKEIPGYEGIYEISNTGVVRGRKGIRKILVSWDGYQYVKLCNRGHEKKFKVHRLVALAFLPNPLGFPEINHKDENKENNNVCNLEWCDRKYNNNYGKRNIVAGISIRKANQRRVFRYDKNLNFLDSFVSAKEAEKILKIDHTGILKCANNKRKTAGGFIWKYHGKG